jgi:hypothetical protein
MEEVFLTREEAEDIVAADQIGVYDCNYPGAKSKLAHARLLLASPCNDCDERVAHGCLGDLCPRGDS